MKDSLKQRLAITTGAAAAAFGPAAVQGAVVYTNTSPITATFNTPDNSDDWDVDGDGQTDFRVVADRRTQTGSLSVGAGPKYSVAATADVWITSNGLGGRGLVKEGGGNADFRRLAAGFAVGPTLASGYSFSPPGLDFRQIVEDRSSSSATKSTLLPTASAMYGRLSAEIYSDHFQNGAFGNNFIGFRFDISGAMHYGWAELFVDDGSGGGNRGDVTITRWAYENTADCGIAVGQTSGDNCTTDIPNPGTLALLAAGAAGLRRWRGKAQAA
jgi:hypothetical protein